MMFSAHASSSRWKYRNLLFHCQHVLARRGQVGALVNSSWYAIWAAGLRGQTQLLLGAEADTEGCWKWQPHKLHWTCGAAVGIALIGEGLNIFLGRAVQHPSARCTATQAFVSDYFLFACWSWVQEFSPSSSLMFPWFFCICGRIVDFVGLGLETKEQIALVQEALSWHSSFSFGWFGTASVGIAKSLLDEIKLIILGRHWEATRWEWQQEHQAL